MHLPAPVGYVRNLFYRHAQIHKGLSNSLADGRPCCAAISIHIRRRMGWMPIRSSGSPDRKLHRLLAASPERNLETPQS